MIKSEAWLKKLENVTLYTLFKQKEFKIEKVFPKVTQIRAGSKKVLIEIPNEEIYASEKVLLTKKTLAIKDIPSKQSLRTYIIAILALQYDARIHTKPNYIKIDERVLPPSSEQLMDFDISFKHGWKISPEQLEEFQERKQELGNKAEQIVMDYEKAKLKKNKLTNLVERIRWTSKEDCSAGYDIQSFDENGKLIFIEVKGTYSESNRFYLSLNELERAKREGDSYFVYHVKKVGSAHPEISRLKNPHKLLIENKISVEYSQYSIRYVTNQFYKETVNATETPAQ